MTAAGSILISTVFDLGGIIGMTGTGAIFQVVVVIGYKDGEYIDPMTLNKLFFA